MLDYRMPGVYTEEIPTLPPSIAVVQSAVPCFIGYTETIAEKEGVPLLLKAIRVRNMRDYEAWFGTSPNQEINVNIRETIDDSDPTNLRVVRMDVNIALAGEFKYRMHYAMQLYFANGGGPCFIISVGLQSSNTILVADLIKGLDAAKLAKDVTILVFPDACALSKGDYYATLVPSSLQHCDKMKNRVLVIDVKDSNKDNTTVTDNFRTLIPQNINQKYAAAYYPFLNTTLDYKFEDTTVHIKSHHAFNTPSIIAEKALEQAKEESKVLTEVKTSITAHVAIPVFLDFQKAVEDDLKAKSMVLPAIVIPSFEKAGATAASVKAEVDALTVDVTTKQTAFDTAQKKIEDAIKLTDAAHFIIPNKTLKEIESNNNLLYNKIKETIRDMSVIMPPSAAIAGVFVQTDATQGVWKAPANVGLAAVVSTTVDIDDDFHAELNVDSNSGKSVNAIRPYSGKGILVFGSRTLMGNNLEWQYVPVRRTFCFIEDSIARAMQDFIFAPNTRSTWIIVKSMISNFLNNIWQAGGLFGNTPNEAYMVSVGQPETMTDVDILEGKMIVEIKLRVSRPAEFIILRYEHKFQVNAA